MAQGAEEVVEEVRSLALLITGQVGGHVGDEVGEGGGEIGNGREARGLPQTWEESTHITLEDQDCPAVSQLDEVLPDRVSSSPCLRSALLPHFELLKLNCLQMPCQDGYPH